MLHIPVFPETVVIPVSYDKMIHKRDAEDLSRILQAFCELFVLEARIRVTRGMVVRHDHGSRMVDDSWGEHFPRMDYR